MSILRLLLWPLRNRVQAPQPTATEASRLAALTPEETLFAFLKTDTSFHGGEPIGDPKVLRDVLLYDIRVEETPAADRPADAAAQLFREKVVRCSTSLGD